MIEIKNRVVDAINEINVANDKEVIKLQFKCKNQVTDLIKLSDCTLFINYQNGSLKDRYAVQDLTVNGEDVTFGWTLGKNATAKSGKTYFVICAVKMNGSDIEQEWNSVLTSFDVKKGLETITAPTKEMQDLFAELTEMVEGRLTPDNIKAGQNVTVEINGNDVTINSTGGGTVDAYTKAETDALLDEKQDKGDYATATKLGAETLARINADSNLQNQIDAITVSSDVVDVVGTYADLQNYDTSHIKANDIIKVMQDSTHGNAISYYRWVITEGVGAWVYVGSEGPYYTKAETDELLRGVALKFTTVQSKPANPDLNTIYGIVAGELFPDVSDYITTDYPYIAVVKDGSIWKLVQFKTQDMWEYYGSARSLDYAVRTLVNGGWGEATEYTGSDSWSEIFHLSGVDPAYNPTGTNARLKEYIYYSNSNWYCQNRGGRYTPTGTPNDNKTDVYGVPVDPSLIDRRVLRCWKHNGTEWVDLGLVDYNEMFDDIYNKGEVDTALSGKQATLVNQSNIKSINGTSLLGSGDIAVQPVTATATITDNSTTALADNTEYTGTNLSTVTFTYPQGDFECYMSLSFASSGTITVTFPTSQYIGSVPTFENGKTYEVSIKNGVIVAGEVTSGA